MDPTPHRRNRIDRVVDCKVYDAFNLPACPTSLCHPLPDATPDYYSYEQLKVTVSVSLSILSTSVGYDAASGWQIGYYPPGHPQRRRMEKITRKYRDDQDQHDGRPTKMRKYREEDQYDGAATKVVLLTRMLSSDDHIEEDDFYQDFLRDVMIWARKYGNLVRVVIPRPSPGGRSRGRRGRKGVPGVLVPPWLDPL
ncbi:hypothetical protein VPH35_099486 [Triticum aestivum]|uniref:Splicing factor U2af large subunit B n=1 Tax=Aegilops tauschii TaxID=37682 RepID=M8B2W3_AEGTA